MGLLPDRSDNGRDVKDKLRAAFLSCQSNGEWQTAPQTQEVVKLLRKQGLLQSGDGADAAIFLAMAKFIKKQGLLDMKTFNGRLWQLSSWISKDDPSFLGAVDFRR